MNFFGHHNNYYNASRYTTIEDSSYIQSVGHPDLRNYSAPSTTFASQSLRRYCESDKALQEITVQIAEETPSVEEVPARTKRKRRNRLSVFDVSQIAVERVG